MDTLLFLIRQLQSFVFQKTVVLVHIVFFESPDVNKRSSSSKALELHCVPAASAESVPFTL